MSEFLRRRTLLQGLIASTIALLFPALAQAAGPLIKPTKIGQKIIFQGYTYSVVKSKGKLIWRKGAKYIPVKPTPTPSATATPTPSATPTPTATPTSTPTTTPTPTSTPTPTFKGVVIAQSSQILEGKTKIIDAKDNNGRNQNFAISRISGNVKVFSSVCTHQGCVLAANGANLACNCHGSEFSGFDGSVKRGPAGLPLTEYRSLEEDGSILLLI
jgi:Rieske Fe-S protein